MALFEDRHAPPTPSPGTSTEAVANSLKPSGDVLTQELPDLLAHAARCANKSLKASLLESRQPFCCVHLGLVVQFPEDRDPVRRVRWAENPDSTKRLDFMTFCNAYFRLLS